MVDVERCKPISRLGGNTYAHTSGLFDLPRPDRSPAQAAGMALRPPPPT